MDTVADKLCEARALVAKGWCQKSFTAYSQQHPEQVCYCVYGAINQAVVGEADAETSETLPYEKAVGAAIGLSPKSLATWNDLEGRTQAEVVAAFDKAIELAEAGQ